MQGSWHGPNCTSHSLHVTGPRHCPRIDEPHPASIASTRPVVARCAWKQIAQMVRNRACVPNWHKRKFSQDMLNRDDIQDWFLMVKLVYNLGSNRLQPSCRNKIINIIYIIRIKRLISIIHIIRLMHVWRIIRIIRIMHINHITTIFRIVVCFHRWHKCTVEGLDPVSVLAEAENRSNVCFSRGWEQKQYSSIPNCFLRHNKCSIVDYQRLNHDRDRVQSVTAVKRFCRKRVAVYPLHTCVLGVYQHQAVVQSKMTLVSGWILQLQCLKKGCYLTK